MRFVWAGESAAIALGCVPKADQTSVPRPPWRGGLGTLSNEPWSGSFVARTRSDLKQTQLQKDLRIFGLNQLHCALWDKQVFFDSLQFSIAGRGQTLACEEVRRINPRSCLSIIAVCCLLHFTPVFVYFRKHRWNFPARSFWPIEKQFRECGQRHI